MAPLLFALALMMQDAPAPEAAAPDAPMATAVPRKQAAAPLPIQGGAVTAPTDDYGYVGWCYGVIASYVELYDRAMPEVIRIERAWPTPSTEENIAQVYPAQREEGKRNLTLFTRAMLAAEKASPTPIQDQGVAAVRRGRAMWTGATSVPKAQLAQFWMSWSPPAKCEETAKALEARSLLFGQALNYNVKGVTTAAPPPPPAADDTASAEPPSGELVVGGSVIDPKSRPEPSVYSVSPPEDPTPPQAEPPTDIGSAPAPTDLSAGDAPMVEATPLPSDDPEVELSGEGIAPGVSGPIIDAAALSSGAPTAIDDLLPVGEPEATPPPTEDEPAATPAEEAPPVIAAPAAEPARPAPPKRKRDLKETLQGMRGPQ